MSRWSAKRWLRAFRDTGGIAWLHSGNVLGIGFHVRGWSFDQHAEARRLIDQLDAVEGRYLAASLQVAWSG